MSNVAALMQRRVCTAGMDASLAELEALFAREGLSWAPVVEDGGTPVGVVSAADLLRARAAGRDAAAAWQLCSYKPVTVPPEAAAAEVARLLVQRDIHHVIVMEEGRIAGVVSALDLLRGLVEEPAAREAAVPLPEDPNRQA